MQKIHVGVIGCGNISGIYLQNLTGIFADRVHVAAVCSRTVEKAQAAAAKYGAEKVYATAEELVEDDSIQLVLNLTPPNQHTSLNLLALEHGKHVYCEKPLAITREDARKQLDLARQKGLKLGCAPDTFLGAGLQTARKLLDDGAIGDIVSVNAAMHSHGVEHWHPSPEFYYKRGGGPMFDMGPYYLTALVSLAGPVEAVSAYGRVTFPQRKITSQPRYGQVIDVEVPTHMAGVMRFVSGAVGTITTTFDVYDDHQACLEIFGTRGSLRLPDPNKFGGPVQLLRAGELAYAEVPLTHAYAENSRGLGVWDMCRALQEGGAARTDAALACHVVDLMCAFHDAAQNGHECILASTCHRPAAMEGNI